MKQPLTTTLAVGILAPIVMLWTISCSSDKTTLRMSPQFVAQGRGVLTAIQRCDRSHRGPFISYDPLLRNARQALDGLRTSNGAEHSARQALANYLSAVEFARGDWERFDQTARSKIVRDETDRAEAEADAARTF